MELLTAKHCCAVHVEAPTEGLHDEDLVQGETPKEGEDEEEQPKLRLKV